MFSTSINAIVVAGATDFLGNVIALTQYQSPPGQPNIRVHAWAPGYFARCAGVGQGGIGVISGTSPGKNFLS
jgi:hypothetical protein